MLPDVNAETYPYDVVQQLLDQTATFTFYATPAAGNRDGAALDGGRGLRLNCDLRAFDSALAFPAAENGVKVRQTAGPAIGTLRCVLRFAQFADEELQWHPDQAPPAAILDGSRTQRFVLTDPEFTFRGGDAFRGFGVGRTYPVTSGETPRLLAGAVGNITTGTGSFGDHEGEFALCGTLNPDVGFEGLITCRIIDPAGILRTDNSPDLKDSGAARTADTFILMRGEKKDRSVRTTFGPSPGPNLQSLMTPTQMRNVYYGCATEGRAPRAGMRLGAVVGKMDAEVHFNLAAPPGTAAAPGPFKTREVYEFVDERGRTAGTIDAGVVEGISFGLQFPAAPGQPGVRFTGYGPVTGGTGAFAGVQGLLTVNSVIGIAPHALSLTHVLHLVDPSGRFRATA